MKEILSILIFLAVSISAQAQSMLRLSGMLKDESTQLPIYDADILVIRSGQVVSKVTSDTKGFFSASLLLNQEYQIKIQHESYLEEKLNLSTIFPVKIDSLPQLDILLIPVSNTTQRIVSQPLNIENNSAQKVNCKLEGKIFSRDLGLLPDQEITLMNIKTRQKQITNSSKEGVFEFLIQPNQNYHLFVDTDTSSPFVFSDIYLSTMGVQNALTIIRNIERQINPEKAKLFLPAASTLAKVESPKSKTKQPKEKVVKPAKEAKTKEEKLPKPPKIKDSKSIIAKNVVVKITDVEKPKNRELTKQATDTSAMAIKAEKIKTTENKEVEKKANDKVLVAAQPIDSTQIKEKIRKQQERDAYARRLDSMIGTGQRFMHKEEGYDKRNSPNTKAALANQSLPVLAGESRTPVISNKIYYGPGKAELDSNAVQFLYKLADTLKSNSSKKLVIKVFCDNNLEKSVQDYLNKLRISRINAVLLGVDTPFKQLEIKLLGGQLPVNSCTANSSDCTELDHQMNRRVEFSWSSLEE